MVGQAAVELFFHVLAFAQAGASGQPSQLGGHVVAVQIRGTDLDQFHAQLAVQKTRQRDFELRVGEKEYAFALQQGALARQGLLGALARGAGGLLKQRGAHPKSRGGGLQPGGGALGTQREGGAQVNGTARFKGTGGIGQKGLGQQKAGAWTDDGQLGAAPGREKVHRHTHGLEQLAELVFHHIGQGAHHQQARCAVAALGQGGCQRGQASVFALGEGGFDAAARVVEHPHRR